MRNETRQDTSFFNKKQEKQEKKKNWKNREKTLKKQGGKTGKKRKLQEILKQDLDDVSGNAENGNEFLSRFQERLKTETRTKIPHTGDKASLDRRG